MDVTRVTAKTLDEAITKAAIDLGTSSDNLEYSIEEQNSGIFGLFGKSVTIKAFKKSESDLDELYAAVVAGRDERKPSPRKERPARDAVKDNWKNPGKEAQEDTPKNKEKEALKDTPKNTEREALKDTPKNAEKELAKEPGKEPGKELGKESSREPVNSYRKPAPRNEFKDQKKDIPKKEVKTDRQDNRKEFKTEFKTESKYEVKSMKGREMPKSGEKVHPNDTPKEDVKVTPPKNSPKPTQKERQPQASHEPYRSSQKSSYRESIEAEKEAQRIAAEKRAEKERERKENRKPVDVELCKNTATDFLTQVFGAMGMNVEMDAVYDDEEVEMIINLSGEDMGVLIGKRGQTLDSLQYLVSLVVNKKTEGYLRVKLDTENYRARRKETLEALAKNIAYKVKRTRRSVSLEPMNPYERRIIHSTLQNDRYVVTRSEGEDPYRHVVVSLKREVRERDRRGGYSRNNSQNIRNLDDPNPEDAE